MKKFNKHGKPPFQTVFVHGGPGAAGELALLARELSSHIGILEPFQTEDSINGQVEELKNLVEKYCKLPAVLLGHSWGAWLSYILTAKFPKLVKKLILVSSGPFVEYYARDITKIRLSRLEPDERNELVTIITKLNSTNSPDREKDLLMAHMAALLKQADSFDLASNMYDIIECQYKIYNSVWPEAELLRRTGKLLKFGENITCPVLAIHGDHDPHPAEGVKVPLSKILADFRFIQLKNCGHYPWLEKSVKEEFFNIILSELK